jgi:hypothetical protein
MNENSSNMIMWRVGYTFIVSRELIVMKVVQVI